jgi:hypothetical protein
VGKISYVYSVNAKNEWRKPQDQLSFRGGWYEKSIRCPFVPDYGIGACRLDGQGGNVKSH